MESTDVHTSDKGWFAPWTTEHRGIPRLVRPARIQDVADILNVIEEAKAFMVSTGNTQQWQGAYPAAEHIEADIAHRGGYVVEEEGRVVGYFAFLASPEPTYACIYGGRWLDDAQPYHVIHRIAALKATRGIFHTVMDYCALWEKNLRVDTHRDNRVMQHLLLQHGFTYCGIIHLASGDERLAYQRFSSS